VALVDWNSEFEGDLSFGAGQEIQVNMTTRHWLYGSYDHKGETRSGVFAKDLVEKVCFSREKSAKRMRSDLWELLTT
jgi:hypothetical protein